MNNKNSTILRILLLPFLLFLIQGLAPAETYAQDKVPREYTNPDEVVTFDRNTSFQRALDVINEFAQENLNKVIIDRTKTEGNIGISIPPMHWRDALDLMLRVKNLALVEQKDFFEIVSAQSQSQTTQAQAASGGGQASQQEGEAVANIGTREVRINAIFFEGNRRALQEVGVDWSTLTENVPENVASYFSDQAGGGGGGGGGGSAGGGANQGQLPATSGFENQFVAVNAKGAQNVSQSVFSSLINFGEIGTSGIEVQALFSAFEADNLGEILASPSIKVQDGQEGRIQVGQDFSIKQRDFAGNVTDQFFSVGTILTVTPTIIEQRDTTVIHLDIQAERSSAQPDPVSTIVNKQTAETQAILVDGEATAIAGLYRSEVAEVRRGVPILKDLPPWLFGLRYLFGYNSKDYQMRELVILVQAHIEPTVAERYNKELQNKFDVLNDQRRRYRDELEQKDKYSPTKMEKLEANDDQKVEQPQPEEEQMREQSPEEAEQPKKEPVSESTEVDSTKIQAQNMPEDKTKNEEEEVMDPELTAKPVPLNLGGEETEQQDSAKAEMVKRNEPIEQTERDQETAETEQQQSAPPLSDQKRSGNVEDYTYFVIGASFTNLSNARDYRDKLSEQGFNAMILANENSTFHFVAYTGYKNRAVALDGLANIRESYNSDAWLYKK